jgi:hypothetical protein
MRVPMVCVGGALDGERWACEPEVKRVFRIPTREPSFVVPHETLELTTTYWEYEVTCIHCNVPGQPMPVYFLKPRGSNDLDAIEHLLKHHYGAPGRRP